MVDQIYAFFETVPPAFDLVVVPWFVNLINGNIMVLTFTYVVLKYLAVKSPWAWDDNVFTFFTGLASELKKAMPLDRLKKKKEEVTEEACGGCGENCTCAPEDCTCVPVEPPVGEGLDGVETCPTCHRPV
ncbi:MAG: hypothetical protein GWN17_09905 [Candidatus Korarchaeota archaeon]|nr:hypothetical protein [Candidatus Korarchaeota archaeon]